MNKSKFLPPSSTLFTRHHREMKYIATSYRPSLQPLQYLQSLWNYSSHTKQKAMFPRRVVMSISGYRQTQNTSTPISLRTLFLLDGLMPGNFEIFPCWKQCCVLSAWTHRRKIQKGLACCKDCKPLLWWTAHTSLLLPDVEHWQPWLWNRMLDSVGWLLLVPWSYCWHHS